MIADLLNAIPGPPTRWVGTVIEAVDASHVLVAIGSKVRTCLVSRAYAWVCPGHDVIVTYDGNVAFVSDVVGATSAPKALVRWSGAQSCADSATTTLSVSSAAVDYETVAGMRTGDALVAPIDGFFRAWLRVLMTGNSSGNRLIEIRHGSTTVASYRPGSPTSAIIHMAVASPPVKCVAGDAFSARVTLGSVGASLTVTGGDFAVSWCD